MFESVQFPAGITDLNTSLTNMERDNLTHFYVEIRRTGRDEERIREEGTWF